MKDSKFKIVEFQAHELKKYFTIGDHVHVIGGPYKNETGLIVLNEDHRVAILSDRTMQELHVLPKDLQLYFNIAVGADEMGHFKINDFVDLGAQSVGVIVRFEKENIQVHYSN